MIGKRLLWFTVGVGVGAGAVMEGRRRVQQAMRRRTPAALANRLGDALVAGRDAMRAREDELRHGHR